MQIYTKQELNKNKSEIIARIIAGEIFIYPTDTVYGIGCDATNDESVKKLRDIKRSIKPWSVIAPGKKWIKDNFILNSKANEWMLKLPGAYTLILNLENKLAFSKVVNRDKWTQGVRLPDNWFTKLVETDLKIPIITTSANITGKTTITEVAEIEPKLKKLVDFAIDDGTIKGDPSTLVDLTGETVKVTVRKSK